VITIHQRHRQTDGRTDGQRDGGTKNAGLENAGLENVGPNRRGGKRGTGKRGTKFAGVENAGLENTGTLFVWVARCNVITDRERTCDRITALCTKVHRAVKTKLNT